jgi:hypothetical protein
LFKNTASKASRIRELARLTKTLFDEVLDYNAAWNKPKPQDKDGGEDSDTGETTKEEGGSNGDDTDASEKERGGEMFIKPLPSSSGKLSNKEASQVAQELASLYGTPSASTMQFLKKRDRKIWRNLAVWSAYSQIVPLVKSFSSGTHESFKLPISKWRPGMPIKKLDVRASVSRYGVLIPGVTTLARTDDPRTRGSPGSSTGNLCLLVDSSGSMYGSKVDRVVEAAIGLIETARHFRDRFSLISMTTGPSNVFEPSTDYQKAVDAAMEFEGGGDCRRRTMLDTACGFAKQEKQQLTVILSDNIPPDNFCDQVEKMEELLEYGSVIFIVLTDGYWNETMKALAQIKSSKKCKAVLVENPETPFTWQVLDPVWWARGN